MKRSDKKAKKIEKAMRLIWSSLDSHLPYTHLKARDGTKMFHKKCVKEYSELIKLISDLY